MTVDGTRGLALPVMGLSQVDRAFGLEADRLNNQPRMFKRHKVLPHPRKEAVVAVTDLQLQRPRSHSGSGKLIEAEPPLSQTVISNGSRRVRRQDQQELHVPRQRRGRGPEPPPTPPAHSRTSSTSHPVDLSSDQPDDVESSAQSIETAQPQSPATPPNPQTPLTPEITPPGPAENQPRSRPPLYDRLQSKITTDSSFQSYKTAPEVPLTSPDEEDGRLSLLRPALPSAQTSQSTVRQLKLDGKEKSQPVGLGLGLESSEKEDDAPTTEFDKFDGEWPRDGEVGEEWNANRMRNVSIRKRKVSAQKREDHNNNEVLEDSTVSATNATKALRSVSLQDSPMAYPARRVVSDRVPNRSESSIGSDAKRSSIMSNRSTASTVVDHPDGAPRRRKTLRHMKKQIDLRDSSSELSPASSAPTSISAAVEEPRRGPLPASRLGDSGRDSHASVATLSSISSNKARRDAWKAGAIAVAIVPERRSSIQSNKSNNARTPSLRSTSTRRSQRSHSLSSAPQSRTSKSVERVPIFDRPQRRGRALSESDGGLSAGDERTIDFPPVIPKRSSSLSAPTSRNASRSGSLTAESLKAHDAMQAQHRELQKASRELNKLVNQRAESNERVREQRVGLQHPPELKIVTKSPQPEVTIQQVLPEQRTESRQALSNPDHDGAGSHDDHHLSVDRYGDPLFGKRLSAQNTPFSIASVETAGTSHAEVSEAMAVNIYPHQSKSVVLVDHSAKPSESSSLENPVIVAEPATPPQRRFSFEEVVDSPLRNPRAPPEPPRPPVINFIPATPSGLTPMTERQKTLGNYFEVNGEGEKPRRSQSLLRRALTGGRKKPPADYYGPSTSRPAGLLTRTFSLGRHETKAPRPGLQRRRSTDDRPRDENLLHPFWRPAYHADDDSMSESESDPEEEEYYEERGRTYKYPLIDNRPGGGPPVERRRRRKRSLSQRLKRTFAILPVQDKYGDDDDDDGYEDDYYAVAGSEVERRTIRRTPSGNLRVMRFRKSLESLRAVTAAAPEPRGVVVSRPPVTRVGRPLLQGLVRRLSRGRSGERPTVTVAPGVGGGVGSVVGGQQQQQGEKGNWVDRMNLGRRLSERRREKRTEELRKMISRPREVRDGVGDVIRRMSWVEEQRERERERERERGGAGCGVGIGRDRGRGGGERMTTY
ncbi:hypothetical protein QBC41DRAFT_348941 [Cercophora samala]|uniref:Uncharacterized protein n=1 Tax=Cercophora samala TaxID=330535 RepID=A0AA39Z8P3_9PEZI|nr:hypothetical protein QBC41DRAFT_348941 [Cercophora samala]